MTRKTITIIIVLAAIPVLIGGYFGAQAWIKAHPKYTFDYSNFPESPKLTDFDSSKMNRIENITEGFALERRSGNWELVSAKVPVNKVKIDSSLISNRLWSMASIWAESLVEEEPADISIYGLDNPRGRVLLGDTDGKKVEFIIGNYTPTRTSHYVMLAGKPEVYSLSTYSTNNLFFTLDSIRNKDLAAYLDPRMITRFTLTSRQEDQPGKGVIDIVPKTQEDVWMTSFTSFIMNSPYSEKLGVDSEKFGGILEAIQYLQILEFVDDDPSSLAPYGLDKPGRLYFETPDGSLDILYGKGEYGARYAKYSGVDSVFLLEGLDPIISPMPFSLIDKFAMIHNIDNVSSFTVTWEGRSLFASIDGKGEDAKFHLNGRRCADSEFRKYYQAVIGLLIDAELKDTYVRGEGTDLYVEYQMNTPPGVTTSVRLVPFNRDFFVLERRGVRQFMIARTQVREIFAKADSMVYLD